MINQLNLHYFIVTAQEKNITRAAEKLYISQQALSGHISSIEKELGVKLFERGNELKMTYAGTVFYKYAMEIEDSYRKLDREIEDIKEEVEGEIAIGVSNTWGRHVLPRILPAFIEKYPKVKVRVLEGNMERLTTALLNREVSLIVSYMRPGVKDIVYEPLIDEELEVVAANQLLSRYGLSADSVRESVEGKGSLSVIKDLPFLMNKRGNAMRTIVDLAFRKEGIIPHILIETDDVDTLKDMCRYAIGIAFYPVLQSPGWNKEVYTVKKIEGVQEFKLNAPYAKMTLAVGYLPDTYMSRALKEMINIIKNLLEQ